MTFQEFFDSVKDFISSLGWVKGVFAIFFFVAHYAYYRLFNRLIKYKQSEIDRLASENRDYREKYLKQIDEVHSYTKKQLKKV